MVYINRLGITYSYISISQAHITNNCMMVDIIILHSVNERRCASVSYLKTWHFVELCTIEHHTYHGEVQGDVILYLGTGIKQPCSVWERNPSAAGTACKEIAERDRRRRSTMYLKVYAFLDVHCKSRATKSVNISKHHDSK